MRREKTPKKVALVSFSPNRLLAWLVGISLLLVAIHVGLQYLKFHGGAGKLTFLTDIFNVDNESSVPTWFSQFLLFISAAICWAVAFIKRRRNESYHRQWKLMSAVFLFLSIDEIATIHEHLINIVQNNDAATASHGISAWYAYAAIMVGITAIFLAKFWWKLPLKTKLMLAISAFVYLFGAVYFDNFDGGYVGRGFLHDGILVGIEEGLEMIGACMFAYTLSAYAYSERLLMAVQFKPTPAPAPQPAEQQTSRPVPQGVPARTPKYIAT